MSLDFETLLHGADIFPILCSYDYLFKVVLIGDSGVGKSNLLSRSAQDERLAMHILTATSHQTDSLDMSSVLNQSLQSVLNLLLARFKSMERLSRLKSGILLVR